MNNTTIINIFNSDNSNTAYIKSQNTQIIATIAYKILKFESMTFEIIHKYGGETSPRPFSENLKLSISLDQQSKVL